MPAKVIISDRIRFSRKLLPKKIVLSRYDRSVYDEAKCDNCDNLEYRHNDVCDNCPAFKGRYRFFSQEEAKQGIWSVPQGDIIAVLKKLRERHPDIIVKDKRPRIPFDHPIKFTGRLHRKGDVDEDGRAKADQVGIIKKWMKHKHGVIRAAPRTGKTVMATAIYCAMGQKTVIIASQKEWLKQFYETATGRTPPKFRGKKKISNGKKAQRRKAVTNIRKLQLKTGKEIIRFIDKFSELEQSKEYFDIILMTYQALMRDPERIVKYLNGRYTFLEVDEQHKGSAHAYMRVLAQLNMSSRLSLSATDKRKDSRDLFGRIIMGPVVATSKTNALVPHIRFEPTGFRFANAKSTPKRWPTVYKRVCYDLERNKTIVRRVFEDLRAGHTAILVPVDYIEHIKGLTKMINRQAKINNKKRGEDWPIELAKEFHRAVPRDETIEWVDNTDWDIPNKHVSKKDRGPAPRVLVARQSMIKEGIDFARPTSIHIVLPMSANSRAGGPGFYQLSNRVCTPIPGKRTPVVRIYVDENIGMFQSAISGLLWHEIYPNSTMKDLKHGRYYLSKQQYAMAKALTQKRKDPTKEAKMFSGSWI